MSIKPNSTLSGAYYTSLLTGSRNYSGDAKESLKKISRYTNGDLNKLHLYLQMKPRTSEERFTYKVVHRKVTSIVSRNEINGLKSQPTLKNGAKSIGLEAFATYQETMLKYAKKEVPIGELLKGKIQHGVLPTVASAVGSAGGYLMSSNDSGANTAGGMIIAGQAAITVGQTVMKVGKGLAKAYIVATDMPTHIAHLPSNVRKVAAGAARETLYTVGNVIKTGQYIKEGTIKTLAFAKNTVNTVKTYGLISKVTLSKVGHTVSKVAKQGAVLAGRGIAHTATKTGVTLVKKGIPSAINGASTLSFGIGSALKSSENAYVQGAGHAMTAVGYGIKTGVTVTKASGFAVKTAVKQTVSGVRTGYHAVNYIKHNGLKSSVKMARAKIQQKIYNSIRNAGKAALQTLEAAAKALGKRLIVPLLIALCGVLVFTIIISPIATVASMFSGAFSIFSSDSGGSDTDTDIEVKDVEVREYLSDATNGLPSLREEYIKNLANYFNSQDCDYLRMKTEGVSDVIGTKEEGSIEDSIRSIFYSDEDLLNIIQPVYNSIVLAKFDLQPTDKEAEKLMKDIFNTLFVEPKKVPTVTSTEYCGQDSKTGNGDPEKYCVECHKEHGNYSNAYSNCPNSKTRTHSSYTCDTCDTKHCQANETFTCYQYGTGKWIKTFQFPGHVTYTEHPNWAGEGKFDRYKVTWTVHGNGKDVKSSTRVWWLDFYYNGIWDFYPVDYKEYATNTMNNCGNWNFNCNSYKQCLGHKVITATLNLAGYNQLLEDEFEKPIRDLENKGAENLTEDELAELQSLKDGYELCIEYIKLLSDNYVTKDEWDKVNLVGEDGLTSQNEKTREMALSQVGTIGGQKYIEWYYPDASKRPNNVEWSGCFVSWCKDQSGEPLSTPYATAREGQKGMNKYDRSKVDSIRAGNVLFLDWNGDGKAQRCGIVIGKDSKYFYIVEGNKYDTVNIGKYEFDDTHILGYK